MNSNDNDNDKANSRYRGSDEFSIGGSVGNLLRRVLPITPWNSLPTNRVSRGNKNEKMIFITGCDSGMGYKACIELIQLGYHVIASCLTKEGKEGLQKSIDDLKTHDRGVLLKVIQLDITDEQAVIDASAALGQDLPSVKENGLYGVINVAGFMKGGPVEWTPTSTFRDEININYFGLLHVAKSFLPHLKRYSKKFAKNGFLAESRFVCVTSMIALMPYLQGIGGYASSKAAADTLVNTIRSEVRPFGVRVFNICPGITRTPFLANAKRQMLNAWSTASEETRKDYGDGFGEMFGDKFQWISDLLASDPQDAVSSIVDATTSLNPKTRYYCGYDTRLFMRFFANAPDDVYDTLNGIAYSIAGANPKAKL